MVGFEILFESGRRFVEGFVEPRGAGHVHVPSGRIVVGDPTRGRHDALVRPVPPGRYAATISVAWIHALMEYRVAAAMLRFRAGPVATWEPALADGQDPARLEPGEYFGYAVSGDLACFADAEAAGALADDLVARAIGPAIAASPRCAGAQIPIAGGTMSVFTAGIGGGTYSSFWGLNATGEPVVLVTEFRIIGLDETRADLILAEHWPGTPYEDDITKNWDGASDLGPQASASKPKPAPRKPKPKPTPKPKPRPKPTPKPKRRR